MFEIDNNLPVFQVAKNVKIRRGDVVQLAVEDNQVVLIKSNGLAPLGFAISVFADLEYNVYPNTDVLHARVEFKRLSVSTDNYEKYCIYPVNSNLYISDSGLFTTNRPSEKHPAVAMVLEPPSATINSLKLLWF